MKHFNYKQSLWIDDYLITQSCANDWEVGKYNGISIYKIDNDEYKEVLHLNFGDNINPQTYEELKERLEGYIEANKNINE